MDTYKASLEEDRDSAMGWLSAQCRITVYLWVDHSWHAICLEAFGAVGYMQLETCALVIASWSSVGT